MQAQTKRSTTSASPAQVAQFDELRGWLAEQGADDPVVRFELVDPERRELRDGMATVVMDVYRRTHSEDAFERLVDLERPRLKRHIRARLRKLGARLDEEEILQDVLVNVYRYPHRFDSGRRAAFRVWSTAIVENTIRQQFRRRGRRSEVTMETYDELCDQEPGRAVDPAVELQNSEECSRALRAWSVILMIYLKAYAELNERERELLRLVEIEGRGYAGISEVMGISVGNVKMTVYRARQKIYRRLMCRMSGIAA